MFDGILYFIGLGLVVSFFISNFHKQEQILQEKFVANSTRTILSQNFLNSNLNYQFTGNNSLGVDVFSGKSNIIYIKLNDISINTSNLDSWDVISGVNNNLYGYCLKYNMLNDNFFYSCKKVK